MESKPIRKVIEVLLTAAIYYGLLQLGHLLVLPPDGRIAFWPSSGLAFCALLVFGPHTGIAIFAVSLFLNDQWLYGSSALPVAAVIAAGNTLQAWVLATLFKRRFQDTFPIRIPEVLWSVAFFAVGAMISPLIGNLGLCLGRFQPWSSFLVWVEYYWFGYLTGLLALGPLLIVLVKRLRRNRLGAAPFLWSISCLLIGLTLVLFFSFRNNEAYMVNKEIQDDFAERTRVVQDTIVTNATRVAGVQLLYESSELVSRDEFNSFTAKMLEEHESLTALAWVPLVQSSRLGAFEKNIRTSGGEPDFSVYELDEDGERVGADLRAQYFPITYVEPEGEFSDLLGFDNASQVERLETILSARDNGKILITPPLAFQTGSTTADQILMVAPIYENNLAVNSVDLRRENFLGVIFGTFDVNLMMKEGMQNLDFQDLELYIYDVTDRGSSQFLAFLPSLSGAQTLPEGTPPNAESLYSGVYAANKILAGGRIWLLVMRPGPNRMKVRIPISAWGSLVIGMLLTGGFMAFFHQVQRERAILQRSENEFRALADYGQTGIFQIDRDGMFLYVNDVFVQNVGGDSPQEFIGHDLANFPYLAAAINNERNALENMQSVRNKELEIEDKHGNHRDLLFSAVMMDDVLRATITDFTEQRKATADIRRLSQVVEQMADTMVITDCDGNIQYVNPAFEALTGYSRDDALNKNPRLLKSGKHGTWFYRQLWETILEGKTFEAEFINRKKNGEIYTEAKTITPVRNAEGEITQFIATGKDITERKQVEQELTIFRTIADTANYGKAICDLQGNLTYVNTFMAHEHGYEPKELLGKHLSIFHDKEQMEQVEQTIHALNKDGTFGPVEIWHTRKDGSQFPMLQNGILLRDPEGNPQYMAATAVDISEIKETQAKLAASEKRNKSLVDAIPDLLFRYDRQGTFLDYHAASENDLFLKPQEFMGKTLRETMPPDNAKLSMQALERAFETGKLQEYEYSLEENGVERFFNARVIAELGTEEATVIVRDVTESRQSEAALKTSEERYRLLSEQLEARVEEATAETKDLYDRAPTGYHSLDENGTYTMINETERRWLGYTREEMIGKMKLTDVLTPKSQDLFAKYYPQFRRDGEIRDLEYEFVRKDGSTFPVILSATAISDLDGKFLRSRATVLDNTDRKAIEAEVKRISNLTDIALELAHAGYWYAPMDGSKRIYLSERVTGIHGLQPKPDNCYHIEEDLLKSMQLANEDSAKKVAELFDEILYHDRTEFDGEYAYRRPADDQIVFIHAVGNVILDPITHTRMLVGVAQDITEQHKLQSELAIAKDKAESANRAKSAFLANMSHEIRTPMTAILGFTQILLKDEDLKGKSRDHLETIGRSGEHLLSLINDILELSKIEAGKSTFNPSSFNLPTLIQDMRSMFHPRLLEKGLSMQVELDHVAEIIISDEKKLKEILINLIGNAVKFTDQGGIILRCKTQKLQNPADERDLRLTIDVEDTGEGIAPEELKKLFHAFEQTSSGERKNLGTGLGLTISQSHARLLGGEISVTSTLGVGSCFQVNVLVQTGKVVSEKPSQPARKITGIKKGAGPVRVLIVDDNKENRQVLRETLEPLGFTTAEAENGKVALQKTKSWKPSLVIMDLRMPVMDGFEAAQQIRKTEIGKELPIIGLSASILENDRHRVVESGIDEFMQKPFADEDLLALIEKRLGSIFTYEKKTTGTKQAEKESSTSAMESDLLADVPDELIEKMRTATINANFSELMNLITEVEPHSKKAAGRLRHLASTFEYDTLLQIYQKGS
ncbi:MAG: hypothetical protein PWQ55_2080 [Chloroflexota bacterium]|nr:hypothetical protein [Chloroflexota bacterium]